MPRWAALGKTQLNGNSWAALCTNYLSHTMKPGILTALGDIIAFTTLSALSFQFTLIEVACWVSFFIRVKHRALKTAFLPDRISV